MCWVTGAGGDLNVPFTIHNFIFEHQAVHAGAQNGGIGAQVHVLGAALARRWIWAWDDAMPCAPRILFDEHGHNFCACRTTAQVRCWAPH